MGKKFSKAFLMSGQDYPLTNSITLRHPTIGEVLSIHGSPAPDSFYWMYLQILLSDPYSHMVVLDEIGKNYLETSPYEVFILQWDHCQAVGREMKSLYGDQGISPANDIAKALQFFIKERHCFTKGSYQDGAICFYDVDDPSCQINQDIFEWIHEWVKAINKISSSGQIKPADENARRVLIEDMRDQLKKAGRRRKREDSMDDAFGRLLSAASFCGNGFLTPSNMMDCKLYWLQEALSITAKKANADHLLDGIYHGAIRSGDINRKELDWMN